MSDDHEHGRDTFAVRLRHLIETVHPPDRGPYSYREIARGVTDRGVSMTSTTVHQLAIGHRVDPKMRHVQGLAAFFGVPVDYFYDPEVQERVDAQLESVKVWRDEEARALALRASALGPQGKRTLSALLDALEGQDAEDPGRSRRRR